MLLNELFEKLDRLADSIPPQTLLNLLGKLAVENAWENWPSKTLSFPISALNMLNTKEI